MAPRGSEKWTVGDGVARGRARPIREARSGSRPGLRLWLRNTRKGLTYKVVTIYKCRVQLRVVSLEFQFGSPVAAPPDSHQIDFTAIGIAFY